MFSDQLLQRYVQGNTVIKVINDEGFYFRRIDCYPDDPTEGDREFFGKNELAILNVLNSQLPVKHRMTEEVARQLTRSFMLKEKEKMFIQSWFWHRHMSRFMWNEYAKYSHNTDCALLVVNRFKLSSFLAETLPVGSDSWPVKYVEEKQIQSDAVHTKLQQFENEKEFRISINIGNLVFFNPNILPELGYLARLPEHYVAELANNFQNNGCADESQFKYVDDYGFILKAPLLELIEAIYIPEDASTDFCVELDSLLASKGYTVRCHRIAVPTDDSDLSQQSILVEI